MKDNTPFLPKQIQPILGIEDDQIRQDALLAWYDTLSSDEQEQLSNEALSLGNDMIEVFRPLTEYLGGIVPKVIQDWMESNPELKAYLETQSST